MKRLATALSLMICSLVQASPTLIMGDSHTAGTFGRALFQEIRKTEKDLLELRGSCGSIIHWWYTGHETPCGSLEIHSDGKSTERSRASTPLIDTLLDQYKPNRVIVALGSNYLRGYPETTLLNDIQQLLRSIKEIKATCLWIGPPDMRKFQKDLPAFVPKLESLVKSRCSFVDSRHFTHYPDEGGDGVHFETEELKPIAKSWAKEVAKIIATKEPLR
jgi:hypothetical protein